MDNDAKSGDVICNLFYTSIVTWLVRIDIEEMQIQLTDYAIVQTEMDIAIIGKCRDIWTK